MHGTILVYTDRAGGIGVGMGFKGVAPRWKEREVDWPAFVDTGSLNTDSAVRVLA